MGYSENNFIASILGAGKGAAGIFGQMKETGKSIGKGFFNW